MNLERPVFAHAKAIQSENRPLRSLTEKTMTEKPMTTTAYKHDIQIKHSSGMYTLANGKDVPLVVRRHGHVGGAYHLKVAFTWSRDMHSARTNVDAAELMYVDYGQIEHNDIRLVACVEDSMDNRGRFGILFGMNVYPLLLPDEKDELRRLIDHAVKAAMLSDDNETSRGRVAVFFDEEEKKA